MSASKLPSFLRPRSQYLALESRQLFDGAMFVEAAHAADPAPADATHEAPAQPAPSRSEHAPTPRSDDSSGHEAVPAGDASRQVYVIDTQLGNWQQLVSAVPAGALIVTVDAERSGVDQVAQALAGRSGIEAVHILGHGGAGEFLLGRDLVTEASLQQTAAGWRAIGAALSEQGDILLYGCDISANGQGLAQALAALTGADIASSTNPTGAAALGGDWQLEVATGAIETFGLQIAGFDGLMAAPKIASSVAQLQVAEPSALNGADADRVMLSGWTVSDDGDGLVTVDAVVARPASGPYAGLVVGTLSSAMSGATAITDGLRFSGTAAQAQAWLNQLQFSAANIELGLTAATTTINVTVTDSELPPLSATHSVAVTISPSNDPTTVLPAPMIDVGEIGTTVIAADALGFADPEVAAGTQLASQVVYALTGDTQYGYLSANGIRLGVGSVFTQADLDAGTVVYHHTATGATQNVADNFSVRVNDGATPSDQSAASTVTLRIIPVNQAPTVSGSGWVYEGQPANSAGAAVGNLIEAGGGGDDDDASLSVRLTSLPLDGTMYFTGTATIGGVLQTVSNRPVTQADVDAGFSFAYAQRGGLTYGNDGRRDNDGVGSYPLSTSFGAEVTDAGGGLGPGGSLTSSATIALEIRASNDDPMLSPGASLETTVDASIGTVVGGVYTGPYVVTLTPAMIGASDVDSSDSQLTFRVTSIDSDHGYLLFDGQVMPAGSKFTMEDVSAGRVQYIQTSTAAPGETDGFQFQLVDNTVGPRWAPDGSLINRVGGDYDDHGTGDPSDDTLVSHTFTIHLAVFSGPGTTPVLPLLDPVPTHSDSNFAGHNGVTAYGVLNEGGSVVLHGTGRGASDPGLSYVVSGVPPSQVVYTIEAYTGGGPSNNGTLQIDRDGNGNWVDLHVYSTFTQADLDAGHIRFQHDGGEDFESAVQLSATAGVMVHGTPGDPSSPLVPDHWDPTFNFYATPVNDTPMARGSSNNVTIEGGTLYIDANMLAIADADDAVSESRLEGAGQGGTGGLTLAQGGDNYAYNNDASGANSLGFVVDSLPIGGTLQYLSAGTWVDVTVGARIDASLLSSNGLRFVSDGSEVRSTSFTVRAVDRWNDAASSYSTPATVGILITNVNDAPSIDRTPLTSDGDPASINAPLTVREGGYGLITSGMLRMVDPDNDVDQLQYTLTGGPAQGSIAYSTDGGLTFQALGVGSSFTQADVNANRIYYLHNGAESDGHLFSNGDEPSDRLSFSISDGDKEQRNNEFWIYVDPVNDAPTVVAPAGPVDIDSMDPANNRVSGFVVADRDLDSLVAGETDALRVTVRLLDRNGVPLTLAEYAGVSIGADTSGAASVTGGSGAYLVISGSRAEVQQALDGLSVTFADDRNQLYQVQVIADDRLRDGGDNVVGANGGTANQPLQPGRTIPTPVPTTEPDWYTDAVPVAGSGDPLLGNISAAAVMIRASSVNEPAVLTGGSAGTVYEDQYTRIGPDLALVVQDPESAAFDLPVTVTLNVTQGTLSVGATGSAQGSLTPPAGQAVTIAGDETGTLTLTGRASDIQTLLRDPSAGLAYRPGSNVNHDLNGASAGDVTLHVTLDDGGSRIGGDTGAGSVAANPPPLDVALTIVPINDAPAVMAGVGLLPINGPTLVPGFSIADPDNWDGSPLAGTAGETDFMQVTVRLSDASGVPLSAASYVANHVTIDSAAVGTGVTVDGSLDGTDSALVLRGTLSQINAYLAQLRVSLDPAGNLSNSDSSFRIDVIADDRLRDAGGNLTGGANGGLNNNPAGGTAAVPTTALDPYAVIPAGLSQNVATASRMLFPSSLNDPANITVVGGGITVPESNGSVTLTGIDISDSDALDAPMRATLIVPAGFLITGDGGAGANGVLSGDSRTITLTGSQAQLNGWLNAITIQLADPAGVAGIDDWHGSFPVTIVVDDLGNLGSRPATLVGDSDDPRSINGDYGYADPSGTSPNLITTRTFDVTVTPVNDAPVVADATPVTLPAVNEDTGAPMGASVLGLFPASRLSDAKDDIDPLASGDADDYFGIAINSLVPNPAQGQWQYSIDGGASWAAVGARGDANALVLDASARLRFVPAGDFHGTPNGLTVRLVETDSNGDSATPDPVTGQTVDLGATGVGGTTIYSAGTIALGTSVTNVNDRPTGTSASIPAGVEDQPGAARTVADLFGAGYSDARDDQRAIAGGANAATPLGGLAIVGNAASASQGVWQYSTDGGGAWTDVPAGPSDGAALLLPPEAQLRFVPAPDFNGTPGGLTVRLSDAPVTAQSGVDISATSGLQSGQWSTPVTLSTGVTPVNDAPVLTGTILDPAVAENDQSGTGESVPATALVSGVSVSDPDLASTSGLDPAVFGAGSITVSLTGGFAGSGDLLSVAALPGIASTSGGTGGSPLVITLAPTATPAQVQAIVEAVRYSNTSDNPTNYGGNTTRGYEIVLQDGNNSQAGGNAGSGGSRGSAVLSGTITLQATNDPPVANDDARSVTEGAGPITGNVILAGQTGEQGDTDPDTLTADLRVDAVRTGTEAGTGTAGVVGTDLVGEYGTLRLNADGSYVYTLNNADPRVQGLTTGESLSDVFTYGLSDGAGGSDAAQLSITINGSGSGVPVLGPVAEAQVREAGLVAAPGSPEAGSQTVAGSFPISADDGLASLTIGGSTFTVAQLQSATPASPLLVNTPAGVLAINGLSSVTTTTAFDGGTLVIGATVQYSYTLGGHQNHVAPAQDLQLDESIAISVSDRDGDTATGDLTIHIVDDAPVAVSDSAEIDEDAPAPVTGNVRGNDYQGADVVSPAAGVPVTGYSVAGNATTVAGTRIAGQYGWITIQADGGYTYELDNGNPVVNALRDGQTLLETVAYTLTDSDGDASSAQLEITIHGHTDGAPSIAAVDGNGPATGQATVAERGLVDASGSATTTGSIQVSAPDGLASVTIGGVPIPLADLQAPPGGGPIVIVTPAGSLRITGFVPDTAMGVVIGGRIDYSYTLDRTQDNAPGAEAPGASETTDVIELVVTQADAAATSSTGSLTVRIVDDVPEAVADAASVTEGGPLTATGNIKANDQPGADDGNGVPVTRVRFDGVEVPAGTTLQTRYGSIVIQPDGSYAYTLDGNNPQVRHLIPGETLTETIDYVIVDADGDESSAPLTITINGATNPVTLQIIDGNGPEPGQATVSERGLGDPDDDSERTEGGMRVDAPDGVDHLLIAGVRVEIGQLLGAGTTPIDVPTGKGTLTITGYDPVSGSLDYRYTLGGDQSHAGGPVTDDIVVEVFDRDGDSARGVLTVQVRDDVPVAHDDAASVGTARPDATSVSGNVMGGIVMAGGAGPGDVPDRIGADATPTPVSGVTFGGQAGQIGVPLPGNYGSLLLNADGSYTYSVDPANSRVAGLGDGQTLTEVYTYTITDADGSSASASLVVTLRGSSQYRWPDEVRHYGFFVPYRQIDQGMTPAVFVQLAVAESRETSQRLSTAIATRVAGGVDEFDGEFDGNQPRADLERMGQAMVPAEHVSRDGVAFSRQMARDVERTLAQRGLSARMPAESANSLFRDFDALRQPSAERPAAPQATDPGQAAPERIRVPRADGTMAPDEPKWLPLPAGAGMADIAEAAAPGFMNRVAASAAERNGSRLGAQAPIRVRVPSPPSS